VVSIATVVLHMLKTNFKLILCEDGILTLVNTVMHTYEIYVVRSKFKVS
jgi:hypothetical protein